MSICGECGKQFSTQEKLAQHFAEKHATTNLNLKTNICHKCGQVMVRLEDGTYDCGCRYPDDEYDYPSIEQ